MAETNSKKTKGTAAKPITLPNDALPEGKLAKDPVRITRLRRSARLWNLVLTLSHLLLSGFTAFFIASRIFFGGFYAGERHTLAIWTLAAFLVLLVAIAVLYALGRLIARRHSLRLFRLSLLCFHSPHSFRAAHNRTGLRRTIAP